MTEFPEDVEPIDRELLPAIDPVDLDFPDAVVEPIALPAIVAQESFTVPESWEGFQYMLLEDFDIDNKPHKYQLAQNAALFSEFVESQIKDLESFSTAETMEESMSIILQMNADMSEFLQGFGGRLGADEKSVIIMFLMGQAVPRHPDLLKAFVRFEDDFDKIYDDAISGRAGAIDYDAVEMPEIFNEGQREPDVYIDIVLLTTRVYGRMHRTMLQSHVQVLTNYRARVVAEARRMNVPDELILLACKQVPGWQKELNDLTSFYVTDVFVPVWQARNGYDAPTALNLMMTFLLKNENRDSMRRLLGENNEAGEVLLTSDDQTMQRIVSIFVHQALRIASIDNGRLLAGVTYEMWMARGDNLRLMWNRNLYHRSFKRFAIWGWRKWLQETVLGVTENSEAKEIVKSLLERVSGTSRAANKKTVPAVTLAAALRNYSRQ